MSVLANVRSLHVTCLASHPFDGAGYRSVSNISLKDCLTVQNISLTEFHS